MLFLFSQVSPTVHFDERAFRDPYQFEVDGTTDAAMKVYYKVLMGLSSKPIFRVGTGVFLENADANNAEAIKKYHYLQKAQIMLPIRIGSPNYLSLWNSL